MRIAVVGAGVAGLVSAWILARKHAVTLFEADGRLGGHVHTHDVDDGGVRRAVDSGFIVFNERTYPNFVRLLEFLGVPSQPSEMSFSVQNERTGLEYNGTSLNALFAQRSNLLRPSFHGMLRDILRFNREAKQLADAGDESTSLGDFLDGGGYGREFVDHYLVPMSAAVWSTDPANMRRFPARFLARFFDNHGFLSVGERPTWRTVRGGSARYVDALTRSLAGRIRPATPVRAIRRRADGVDVIPSGGEAERFDHVVIAAHSDQALAMLADPSDVERSVLGAIPYQANEAVLHNDGAVLPRKRLARASWNYLVPRNPGRGPSVTYWMNRLQALPTSTPYCVTLNRGAVIRPERVLARMTYHHPLYTAAATAAQARRAQIQGVRRTWFAGAYWRNGFHEDGVVSALAVAEGFGLGLAS